MAGILFCVWILLCTPLDWCFMNRFWFINRFRFINRFMFINGFGFIYRFRFINYNIDLWFVYKIKNLRRYRYMIGLQNLSCLVLWLSCLVILLVCDCLVIALSCLILVCPRSSPFVLIFFALVLLVPHSCELITNAAIRIMSCEYEEVKVKGGGINRLSLGITICAPQAREIEIAGLVASTKKKEELPSMLYWILNQVPVNASFEFEWYK